MTTPVDCSLWLDVKKAQQGESVTASISFVFPEDDVASSVKVEENTELGIDVKEAPVDSKEFGFELEINTSEMELGKNTIEIRVEDPIYGTTLGESNQRDIKILPPGIKILSLNCRTEDPAPGMQVDLEVGLGSTSSSKIKGELWLSLDQGSGEFEGPRKRVSISGEEVIDLAVKTHGLEAGEVHVTVHTVTKGGKEVKEAFASAFALRPQEGLKLELTKKMGFRATPGGSLRVELEAENIGSNPIDSELCMYCLLSSGEVKLDYDKLFLAPGEKTKLTMEGPVPDTKEMFTLRADVMIGEETVPFAFPDAPVEITEEHDIQILSAISDQDYYSPGDLVVVRAYLEDRGSKAGSDVDVGIRIYDREELFADTKPVKIYSERTQAQFEWVTPLKLKKGKINVEIQTEGSKKTFKKLIQIEEPINVEAHFIRVRPHPGTEKAYRKDPEVLDYLMEGEKIIHKWTYIFNRDNRKSQLDVYTLDSRTKLFKLNGNILRGLKWEKAETKKIFDTLMSYLVLSRAEYPGSIDEHNTWLDKLGFLGTSDIRNILLDRKKIKDTKVDLASWEKTHGLLEEQKDRALKKFKGEHLGFARPKEAEKEILSSWDNAKTRLLKRDIAGADPSLDALADRIVKYFNLPIDFDRSDTTAEDARELYLDHLMYCWSKVLTEASEIKNIYRRIKRENYCPKEIVLDLFEHRLLMFLGIAQRFHIQTSLDPYSSPEASRRAVLDSLENIKRIIKNLKLIFELTKALVENYNQNRQIRNTSAFVIQNLEVKSDRAVMKGALGGRVREPFQLINTGGLPLEIEVTTALPTPEWTLLEPVSSISKDVYISTNISIDKLDTVDSFISFTIPKGMDLKKYKVLFYTSPVQGELVPLLDRDLEDEPARPGPIKLSASKGMVAEERLKVLRKFLNEMHSVQLKVEQSAASALKKKERNLFENGGMVLARYEDLKGIKDGKLLENIKASGYFRTKGMTVTMGTIFKKKKDTKIVKLKEAKDLELSDEAVIEASASVYLSNICLQVILPELERHLRHKYQSRPLKAVSSPYSNDPLTREYLYERESPGLLETYVKGSASENITQKVFDKKLASDEHFKFSNGLVASSLKTWVQCMIDSEPAVVQEHLVSGEFETWLLRSAKSKSIANLIGGFATRLEEDLREGAANPKDVKKLLFQRLEKSPLKGQISQNTVKPLIKKLSSKNAKAVAETLDRLVEIGDIQAIDAIIEKLFDEQVETRLAAINALAKFKDKRAVPPLEKIISFTTDDEEKEAAKKAIEEIED